MESFGYEQQVMADDCTGGRRFGLGGADSGASGRRSLFCWLPLGPGSFRGLFSRPGAASDLGLVAIDLIVLGSNDLPLTITLQPGICPDLALLYVWMRFVSTSGVLAAIDDR